MSWSRVEMGQPRLFEGTMQACAISTGSIMPLRLQQVSKRPSRASNNALLTINYTLLMCVSIQLFQ